VRPPVIASSRSQKREATAGARASRRARVTSTCAPAERAGEIVRGQADPPLQRRQAELVPDARREPRVGRRQRRPGAFVEAAQDHQVGLLQPRLEQAPDEDARMLAVRRPHRDRAISCSSTARQVGGLSRPGRAAPPARRANRSAAARPAGARPDLVARSAARKPPRGAPPAAGEARPLGGEGALQRAQQRPRLPPPGPARLRARRRGRSSRRDSR
jgi:hypothetical protein